MWKITAKILWGVEANRNITEEAHVTRCMLRAEHGEGSGELLLETVACVDRIGEAAGEYKVETTGDAS